MFGRQKPKIQYLADSETTWTLIVGDVHGQLAHLEALHRLFIARVPQTAARRTISVGDLIDRGPDTAGVLDWFLNPPEGEERLSVRGNHEVMFEDFLARPSASHAWITNAGGLETLRSYHPALDEPSLTIDLKARLAQIPTRHTLFLKGLPDLLIVDRHCIVHAAIDPLRPLEQQSNTRLHLGPCLHSRLAHLLDLSGFPFETIVHGHQPHAMPIDVSTALINLDTGCYHTGQLTGLILSPQGTEVIMSKD
jgi:serine/threonine protein phosphatase 1